MPKIVDHDERRAALLAPCLELFAREGYSALTMRRLASALGVSTGTLYHYFEGKRQLFEALLSSISARDVSDATLELPLSLAREVRAERLTTFVSARAAHLTQLIKVALEFERHHNQEERAPITALLSAYRGALKQQLELKDEGQASLLLSALIGALLQSGLDPEGAPLEPQLSALARLAGVLPALEL